MNEQLSQMVSDILGKASDGVGDIAGWVQTDALPQYCDIQLVSHLAWGSLFFFVLVVSAIFLIKTKTVRRLKDDSETYLVLAIFVFGVIGISFILLLFNVVPAINWCVNPDGMFLKTLLNAAMAR